MNNVEWTPNGFTETIKLLRNHGSDTQFIEVKSPRRLPEAYRRNPSSFSSNSPTGGIIICGLDENNDFCTCRRIHPADLEKPSVTSPQGPLPPNTTESALSFYEGTKIFVVTIPPLPPYERPAYIGGKGTCVPRYEMSHHETDLMVAQRTRTDSMRSRWTPP